MICINTGGIDQLGAELCRQMNQNLYIETLESLTSQINTMDAQLKTLTQSIESMNTKYVNFVNCTVENVSA